MKGERTVLPHSDHTVHHDQKQHVIYMLEKTERTTRAESPPDPTRCSHDARRPVQKGRI